MCTATKKTGFGDKKKMPKNQRNKSQTDDIKSKQFPEGMLP